MTGPDGARGRWRVTAAGLAVAALSLVAPAAALAADEPTTDLSREDLGAEVVVGYGRGPDQSRWSPIAVTVSPRVPVVGDLIAEVNGPLGGARRTERVEVAAGATKVVHLLVPPGPELSVRFLPRDGAALQLGGPGRQDASGVYIGGLGAAPALPDTLASLGSDRSIEAVTVDGALLDAGPRAFEALDALVLPAAELADLDDDQRRSVSVAVAQGLDLVVPVGPGDDELPLPWDPITAVTAADGGASIEPAEDTWAATGDELGTAGGERTVVAAAHAGDGRVVATVAAPGESGLGSDAALWSALLQPRADAGLPFATIEQGGFSAGLFGSRVSVPGSLGFALFVLVFVLLVGPVNALALRRWGRREFAWITVPAVTVVFTLLAIGSAAARAPTSSPLVRASWWFDGVGEELTAVGLQGASRGTATVDLPAGHDGIVAEPWSGLTATVARTPDTTRVGVPLESLQTASVVGWGPAGSPPLEVAATFVDDTLEVELTNTADSTLSDVELHLATEVETVDDLASGETRVVVLDELDATMPRSRWADGQRVMMGMPPGGAREPDATAAVALLRGAVIDDTPGPVWVTALLADDPTGTVPRIDGRVEDRGTVVAVGVTPTRESGPTTPYEVQRQVLRSGNHGWRPSPLVIEGAEEVLVRFRLPAGAGPGDLVSTLDAGGPVAGGMDVTVEEPADSWSSGCWEITVTDADGNTGEPEERCEQDAACPSDPSIVSCGGDESTVEACFDDGTCQLAVRVGDGTDAQPQPDISGAAPRPDISGAEPVPDIGRAAPRGPADRALAGVEVFDREAGAFVPAAEAFADGTGDAARLVSPLGEVLVRIRGGGFVDLGQRGLGVGGTA